MFLARLLDRIASPLLIVWDRLPARRSRLVGEFLDDLNGCIITEYLLAYAPELNPVEYVRGHWKDDELLRVCPKDISQLSEDARCSLRRQRRRLRLIAAFWKQSSLAFD